MGMMPHCSGFLCDGWLKNFRHQTRNRSHVFWCIWCMMPVSRVLAGREDTLQLVTLPLISVCDFFTCNIFQPQGCSWGTFGGGAVGDLCLNGWGLEPVSGHRHTRAVNRVQDRTAQKGFVKSAILEVLVVATTQVGMFKNNIRWLQHWMSRQLKLVNPYNIGINQQRISMLVTLVLQKTTFLT